MGGCVLCISSSLDYIVGGTKVHCFGILGNHFYHKIILSVLLGTADSSLDFSFH